MSEKLNPTNPEMKPARSLPVFGWLRALLAAPRRLARLETAQKDQFEVLTAKLDILAEKFTSGFDAVNQNIIHANVKLDMITSALEIANQNIIHANEKLDRLEPVVVTTNQNITGADLKLDAFRQGLASASQDIIHANEKIDGVASALNGVNQNIVHANRKLDELSPNIEMSAQNILFANQKLDGVSAALETAGQNLIHANLKLDETPLLIQKKSVIYGLPGGVAAVQTKDFIIGVPSEEWRLALYLSSGKTFEPGTEKYFSSILKEGMTVLDIGANLGVYSLLALAAGCQVYAYEPTPKIYEILLDNIGINGFEPSGRAHAYNLAVSDAEGEVEFSVFGTSGHNSLFPKSDDDRRIRVKTITLDRHLGHLARIDVVKIDVEGSEPLVLAGMQNIINKNPEIKIIMEFSPSMLQNGQTDPARFIQSLRGMGFSIDQIDEVTGDLSPASDDELVNAYSVNVLLQKNQEGSNGSACYNQAGTGH